MRTSTDTYPTFAYLSGALLGAGLLFLSVGCGPSARNELPDAKQGKLDAPVVPTDATVDTESRVYAHTADRLYRIDTTTNQPVEIGEITGIGSDSITDIAVDKNENIIGISINKLYKIDRTTAAATLIREVPIGATGFTSLSYVPMNLDDRNSAERLVAANNDGEVFAIDPTTGVATPIGSYGMSGNKPIGSSGDIVAVYGAGIYATVNVGSTNTDREKPDYIAKINPVTWKATLPASDTGYDRIFGLAYWKGKVYGFVDVPAVAGGMRTGKFIEMNPDAGTAIERSTNVQAWFGAGVTTVAPTIE